MFSGWAECFLTRCADATTMANKLIIEITPHSCSTILGKMVYIVVPLASGAWKLALEILSLRSPLGTASQLTLE